MTDLRHIEITSFEQLYKLCTDFHDCPFDLDSSVFDPQAGTWTGTFLHPLDDSSRTTKVRKFLVLTTHYFPLIETTLSLTGIQRCTIRDEALIGTYTFNQVYRTETGCRLAFNEDLNIDLELKGEPRGVFKDERELTRRGHVTSLLFMDFGIRLE